MTVQKQFFTKLAAILNKPRRMAGDVSFKKLAAFVGENLRELSISYNYNMPITTYSGVNSRPYNVIGELLYKVLGEATNEERLSIDLALLFRLFDELDKTVDLTVLLRSISKDDKENIFSYLIVLINTSHTYYYALKLKNRKGPLEGAKKVMSYFVTHYASRLNLNDIHLLAAAQFNLPELARAALAKGVLVDCEASDGATPIYFAAQEGSTAVAEILVEHKADVNKKRFPDGPYPTSILVESATTDDDRDFAQLLEYLLLHGADANPLFRGDTEHPLTINAWLQALETGKLALVKVFLKYSSEQAGIKYPVNINVTNADIYNTYLLAMAGDKTGETIKLLRGHGAVVTEYAQTSIGNNPLYMAMRDKKPIAVIEQLLMVFSPYIGAYETHPLVESIIYLIEGTSTIGQIDFKRQLHLFINNPTCLNFNAATILCLLMVRQEKFDFSLELTVLLRYIRENQFPTRSIDIVALYLIINRYIASIPPNRLLASECNTLRALIEVGEIQADIIDEAGVKILLQLDLLKKEQNKDNQFFIALNEYYQQELSFNSAVKVWKIIFSKHENDDDFLFSNRVRITFFIHRMILFLKNLAILLDEKHQIIKFMVDLFNIIRERELIPDENLTLTRRCLPFMQRWFFKQNQILELLLAIECEFAIERKHDPANRDQLVVLEFDKIIDYLVIFLNRKNNSDPMLIAMIHNQLQRISKELENSRQEGQPVNWFAQEMLRQRLNMVWLLINHDPVQTITSIDMDEIIDDFLISQSKDNAEIRGYFLSVLNELQRLGKLKRDYNIISELGLELTEFRAYPQLYRWGKSIEAKNRREQKTQANVQYTRQLAQHKNETSVFNVAEQDNKEKAVDAPINLVEMATEADARLEYRANEQENFWRDFYKERGERFTPRVFWLETTEERKQEALETVAQAEQQKREREKIGELFSYELDGHQVHTKNYVMNKLEYPNMTAQFWGVFALEPTDFPNKDSFDAFFNNFNKGISNKGAGIHHDNGVFRIYPPGDKRAHASVYQKSDATGTPIVMLIFDAESFKHKRYDRVGFYTKNVVFSPKTK